MPDAAIRHEHAPVVGRPRAVLGLLGDERLAEHVRRGSHAAFEALYERHHRGIFAFCRHLVRSNHDAEEVVQQAFTAAYADLARGERPAAPKPWLYGIARHRCLALLRKRRAQPSPAAAPDPATPPLADEVEHRSDLRELLSGVSRLPEPQRTALVLFGLCGHAQAEVAAVLGCDEAKVRALVYQARSSLLEDRRARETPCHEIREKLALGRGGALRRRAIRRHVKFCPGCAEFRAEVLRQRRLSGLIPLALGGGAAGGGSTIVDGSVGLAKLITAALVVTATPIGGGILLSRDHHQLPAPAPHAQAAGARSARTAAASGASAGTRRERPATKPAAERPLSPPPVPGSSPADRVPAGAPAASPDQQPGPDVASSAGGDTAPGGRKEKGRDAPQARASGIGDQAGQGQHGRNPGERGPGDHGNRGQQQSQAPTPAGAPPSQPSGGGGDTEQCLVGSVPGTPPVVSGNCVSAPAAAARAY